MTHIIEKKRIDEIIHRMNHNELIQYMERAFTSYSSGKAVIPPVGELIFTEPKGEAHIKYGYIKGADTYCIKIASGFYDNPKIGLPSSQGMMLLFSQKTGQPLAVLLDEGLLTDIRTAAAGALAAKYFAPKKIKAIGIIGTGIQARLQLQYLKEITSCRKVWVWGRNQENAQRFKNDLEKEFDVHIATLTAELASQCNLIVTTTPATKPLLKAEYILPGTHITAMGSDTATKQELESELLNKADILVVDSIPQSQSRGEVFRAMQDGLISPGKLAELGKVIRDPALQRKNDQQISVVDLTGVAVQDIMIANAVYNAYKASV